MYSIEKGQIKPDPDRLKPLNELPVPSNNKKLKRSMGLFSYYSQWIPKFSELVHPLVNSTDFPMSSQLVATFKQVKKLVAESMVTTVEDGIPLVVETDASEHAVAASLNQSGRPVAFFFQEHYLSLNKVGPR